MWVEELMNGVKMNKRDLRAAGRLEFGCHIKERHSDLGNKQMDDTV